MKKSFFLWMPFIVLVACSQTKIEDTLESDKKALFAVEESQFIDEKQYFDSSIVTEEKDDSYVVRFVISDVKKTYHKVKVLVSDKDKNTFFFGYNNVDYTLVDSKTEKDEKRNIYHGIRISFSSKDDVTDLNVYFQSEEITFFFHADKE